MTMQIFITLMIGERAGACIIELVRAGFSVQKLNPVGDHITLSKYFLSPVLALSIDSNEIACAEKFNKTFTDIFDIIDKTARFHSIIASSYINGNTMFRWCNGNIELPETNKTPVISVLADGSIRV